MKNKNLIIGIFIIIFVIFFIWKLYPFFSGSNNVELEFEIKNNKLDVKVGDSSLIEYELNGEATIKWQSMDTNVVTVHNGIVRGIGYGNTIIKATASNEDEEIIKIINVSTYTGSKDVMLSDVKVPEGELFITKGDSYKIPIEYNPIDAEITSVEHYMSDSNIANYDEVLYAYEVGVTDLTIVINETKFINITINVVDDSIEPVFKDKLKSVIVKEDNITLRPEETKKIEYTIEPSNSYIESIKWESSNPDIVYVDNGNLLAKSSGEVVIKLIVNNTIIKEIKVKVISPVQGINLLTESQINLKVGQKTTVRGEVYPKDATNKKVHYSSSNSCVSIDDNGNVTAISQGSGTITIKSEDGNHQISVPYNIRLARGLINGDGGIWGYSGAKDVVPTRANAEFFRNLAMNGIGVLSGDTYTFTKGKTYVYNISSSTLRVNNVTTMMRIYYPKGADLSSVNTFTFFGGAFELNFTGYFSALDRNPSEMKSSGIIILVSGKNDYKAIEGINATEFVRSIVKQKDGVKNAVGGYSMSGSEAGKAANEDIYNRLIIFNSYVDNAQRYGSLKNKEVLFYSPVGDSLTNRTSSTLKTMASTGYNDLTLVTNNSDLINNFKSSILVINPGNKMGRGHGHANITSAKVFAYACS